MLIIRLKKNRDKPVRMGHPWIFNGAIEAAGKSAVPGELCQVNGYSGELLGIGYYNAQSSISVRMLALGTAQFSYSDLKRRIADAIQARRKILDDKTDSCRLINSEGDFLPGLIVDKYGPGLVIQMLTKGIELFRDPICASLKELCSPAFILERSDSESRQREGLSAREGLIDGVLPGNLVVRENGLSFKVDPQAGQKTGYFFDQRSNRKLLRQYAENRLVCDCFAYSGAFSVNALSSGASGVHVVDSSVSALSWARENIELNSLNDSPVEFISADVFSYLREATAVYDLIVLDPPKFARHPGEVQRASRGYKDINLLAFKRIAPGGIVFTFSCSSAVDPQLFRQIVFAAAADSSRKIQLLHILAAGPDHPINIAHREGEYLKGMVLRVL